MPLNEIYEQITSLWYMYLITMLLPRHWVQAIQSHHWLMSIYIT